MIQWEFIGRLHPLVLHLPIGLIFGLFVLEGLSLFIDSDARVWQIVRRAYCGLLALSSIASAGTGYLLSLEGHHAGSTLTRHMWLGFAVAVLSLLLLVLTFSAGSSAGSRKPLVLRFLVLLGFLAAISGTGHLGGQLTHGPRFLSAYAPDLLKPLLGPSESGPREVTSNSSESPVTAYKLLIQPILERHCVSCHGPDRRQGKFAVHTPESLMAGGNSGPAIVAGRAKDSELVKRIQLDLTEPGHMPPEGKTQLTPSQISAFVWWTDGGASFDAPLDRERLPQELIALLPSTNEPDLALTLKAAPIALDQTLIERLLEKQIFIQRLQQRDQLLWIAFPAIADQVTDETVKELLPLSPAIAWLDLSNTQITAEALATIAQMPALTELNLRQTKINPQALRNLEGHEKLERLNLSSVPLDDSIVKTLLQMPNLKRVYLAGTNLSSGAIQRLSAPRIDVITEVTPSDAMGSDPNRAI